MVSGCVCIYLMVAFFLLILQDKLSLETERKAKLPGFVTFAVQIKAD